MGKLWKKRIKDIKPDALFYFDDLTVSNIEILYNESEYQDVFNDFYLLIKTAFKREKYEYKNYRNK